MPPFESCLICKTAVYPGKRLCSCGFIGRNLVSSIVVSCKGCSKEFSIWPCYKRKSNYCSKQCYWNSTRHAQLRNCKVCSKEFYAPAPSIEKGFGIYCSRECQHKEYPDKIRKKCLLCNKEVFTQPARSNLFKFCSKQCKDNFERDYVTCNCKNCHKDFQIPRSNFNRGRGTFCGRKCFWEFVGPSSLEEKMEQTLKSAEIPYRKEVKFKRFYVDFLLEDRKIVIECDGEYWHLRDKNRERDKRKDIYLKGLGYQVVRFTGQTIDKFDANELLRFVLKTI